MNWANRLTISRLGLTVLFVIALNSEWEFSRSVALVLFAIAGITDYVDGEIARRYGYVTNFGKLMDPLVDKVMTAAAFISLVPLTAIPAWAATIVVGREFLVTGVRLLAISEGKILPAERLGKHKTSWQIATVVFFLALMALEEFVPQMREAAWHGWAWETGGPILVWITVLLTLYSGIGYAWRHRAIIGTGR